MLDGDSEGRAVPVGQDSPDGIREGRSRGVTPAVQVHGHAPAHRSLNRAKHVNHDANTFADRRGRHRAPLEAGAVLPLPGPGRHPRFPLPAQAATYLTK